jgi:hypothetical protein
MDSSAMVTCSPVDSSTSSSRGDGLLLEGVRQAEQAVGLADIAETTTTTWCLGRRGSASPAATAWMRSTLPTEVPPYF